MISFLLAYLLGFANCATFAFIAWALSRRKPQKTVGGEIVMTLSCDDSQLQETMRRVQAQMKEAEAQARRLANPLGEKEADSWREYAAQRTAGMTKVTGIVGVKMGEEKVLGALIEVGCCTGPLFVAEIAGPGATGLQRMPCLPMPHPGQLAKGEPHG